MPEFFVPALEPQSVESLLLVRCFVLHLYLQLSVVMRLITCGLVSVIICMPSIGGAELSTGIYLT